MLAATQQHLEKEMELQKFCQKEKDAHIKTVEVCKTLVVVMCLLRCFESFLFIATYKM